MADGGKRPELAIAGAVQRTIPDSFKDVATSATATATSFAAWGDTDPVDLRGKWIWLLALTVDGTVLRGTHTVASPPALAVGEGIVLEVGAVPQEFYVDPDADDVVTLVAGGVGTIRALYDNTM